MSFFDPYKLYQRQEKNTFKGQIIQKKPVFYPNAINKQSIEEAINILISINYNPFAKPMLVNSFSIHTYYFNLNSYIDTDPTHRYWFIKLFNDIDLSQFRNQLTLYNPQIFNIPTEKIQEINIDIYCSSVNMLQRTSSRGPQFQCMVNKYFNPDGNWYSPYPNDYCTQVSYLKNSNGVEVIGMFTGTNQDSSDIVPFHQIISFPDSSEYNCLCHNRISSLSTQLAFDFYNELKEGTMSDRLFNDFAINPYVIQFRTHLRHIPDFLVGVEVSILLNIILKPDYTDVSKV